MADFFNKRTYWYFINSVNMIRERPVDTSHCNEIQLLIDRKTKMITKQLQTHFILSGFMSNMNAIAMFVNILFDDPF